jgi:hypothetical protein
MAGICGGFLAFGMFIRYLDRQAAVALQAGRVWNYIFFHLVGISTLQPGGMLAEVVGSCAAAACLVTVLRRLDFRP